MAVATAGTDTRAALLAPSPGLPGRCQAGPPAPSGVRLTAVPVAAELLHRHGENQSQRRGSIPCQRPPPPTEAEGAWKGAGGTPARFRSGAPAETPTAPGAGTDWSSRWSSAHTGPRGSGPRSRAGRAREEEEGPAAGGPGGSRRLGAVVRYRPLPRNRDRRRTTAPRVPRGGPAPR